MQKKLTITVDEALYEGLHRVIGRRNISRFLEGLARAPPYPPCSHGISTVSSIGQHPGRPYARAFGAIQ